MGSLAARARRAERARRGGARRRGVLGQRRGLRCDRTRGPSGASPAAGDVVRGSGRGRAAASGSGRARVAAAARCRGFTAGAPVSLTLLLVGIVLFAFVVGRWLSRFASRVVTLS